MSSWLGRQLGPRSRSRTRSLSRAATSAGPIHASAASLAYAVGNDPVPADFDASFTVTGFPDQTWQAVSSVPWLSLVPSGGNAGAPVQVAATVSQEAVGAMYDGSYIGTVTITPSTRRSRISSQPPRGCGHRSAPLRSAARRDRSPRRRPVLRNPSSQIIPPHPRGNLSGAEAFGTANGAGRPT